MNALIDLITSFLSMFPPVIGLLLCVVVIIGMTLAGLLAVVLFLYTGLKVLEYAVDFYCAMTDFSPSNTVDDGIGWAVEGFKSFVRNL